MSLLIATANGLSSVNVSTGNLLKSYKQSDNVPGGIALLHNETTGSPSSVLALQKDRPLIHHYQLKKEAVAKRVVLPSKMTVLALSPNSQWLAIGAQTGALYVWNSLSGALKTLASDAHFQAVQSLAWSKDSSVLVSGGADARVLIWRTFDLIASGALSQNAQPIHVLTQHTLPIVSCQIGAGTFREARLYTASQDATVSVFDIFSGRLLYTMATNSTKLYAMAVDPAERAVYLGSNDGVHCVPLYFEPANSSKLASVGSVEGTVVSTDTVGERLLKPETSSDITALTLSTDASQLFVGTEDGSVSSWETGSAQLIKKYRSTKGAVTQLVFSTGDFSNADDKLSELPVLQRTIEADLLDFVPKMQTVVHETDEEADLEEEMNEIDSFNQTNNTTVSSEGSQTEPAKFEKSNDATELEDLKERYAQLQKMYDALWARHSQS